jgi:hypothetical protein
MEYKTKSINVNNIRGGYQSIYNTDTHKNSLLLVREQTPD